MQHNIRVDKDLRIEIHILKRTFVFSISSYTFSWDNHTLQYYHPPKKIMMGSDHDLKVGSQLECQSWNTD